MSQLELDPGLLETLRTLQQNDVEFVLVGDVAEAIHNDGGFVSGVAIVPGAYARNVERLAAALDEIDAEMGIAGQRSAIQIDYRRADLRKIAPCSFMTRYVDIDLNFEPNGTNGYRDLFDEARPIELAPGVCPLVAATADLERIGRGTAPVTPYAQPPAPALVPEPGLGGRAGEDIRASRSTGSRFS